MPNLLSTYYLRFLNGILSSPPPPLQHPPTNLGANKHRLSTSYIGCQPATDILGGYPCRTLIFDRPFTLFLNFFAFIEYSLSEYIFESNNTKSIGPLEMRGLCLFMQFIDGPFAILLFDSEWARGRHQLPYRAQNIGQNLPRSAKFLILCYFFLQIFYENTFAKEVHVH